MRKLSYVCLGAALCSAAVLAQVASDHTDEDARTETTSSPIAYVYVSSLIGHSSKAEILAYSAASTGKLTKIPGSPFAADVTSLASSGKLLFGSTASTTDIDAYNIESNGALHFAASTNVVTPDGGCGNAGSLYTNHGGATLYDFAFFGNECTNNTYETFKIESSGKLAYLGIAGDTENLGDLAFTPNDKFVYTVGCYHFDGAILAFKRNSNGTLTELNFNIPFPSAPSGSYCGYGEAADPSNHVAIAMQAFDGPGSATTPTQLGTYTVGSTGNMTTSSTHSNMPSTQVKNLTVLNMSPSGKLLAVAGSGGLQIFHFNGASPITHFTGLLTTSEVDQIRWDNHNHLYAIGEKANKLWVFTVTTTGSSPVSGSPFTVNAPQGLKVVPLPL